MSKNREERANYYLYIDGQTVPVSEQVYRVYQHYERKEEYFSYDLKVEKFQKETASFLPSREDSYERLLATGQAVCRTRKKRGGTACSREHLEAEQVRFCLSKLSEDERDLILYMLFLSGKDGTG